MSGSLGSQPGTKVAVEVSAVEIARALNGHREGRRCQCPVCGRGNLMVADMRGSKNLVKCWNDCDYRAVFRELFELGCD